MHGNVIKGTLKRFVMYEMCVGPFSLQLAKLYIKYSCFCDIMICAAAAAVSDNDVENFKNGNDIPEHVLGPTFCIRYS